MGGAHHRPAVAPRRESPRDWKWTPAEKAVARRASDLALSRELEGTVREARERAARITETSGLWELEAWLGEQRRRIDRDFDYRYSVLPHVFATQLRDGRLTEDDLLGLAPDSTPSARSPVPEPPTPATAHGRPGWPPQAPAPRLDSGPHDLHLAAGRVPSSSAPIWARFSLRRSSLASA